MAIGDIVVMFSGGVVVVVSEIIGVGVCVVVIKGVVILSCMEVGGCGV